MVRYGFEGIHTVHYIHITYVSTGQLMHNSKNYTY